MMTLKRLGALTLVSCFAAVAQPLPKAETVLDRYNEVTGGRAAYQKHTQELMTGTVSLPAMGLGGKLTRYANAPNKEYSVLELGPIGKIESGFTNGVAWEKSSILGPRVKTGDEKDQAAREAFFEAQVDWRKIFPKAETIGSESVNGEDCYKILLTPPTGKPETRFYSKKSGLLLKTTTTAVSPMGEVAVEAEVSDYKAFDGVLFPTQSKSKMGAQQMEMVITNIIFNQPAPEGTFDLPLEIKALVDKDSAK